MNEETKPERETNHLARAVPPVLFALAGALFLFLPIAGSSCGEEFPLVEVCMNGSQLIAGEPMLELSGTTSVEAEAAAEALFDETLVIAGWVRAMAVGVLLLIAAGAATALIPGERPREAVGLAAAGACAVLVALTDLAALIELDSTLEFTRAMFTGMEENDGSAGVAVAETGSWAVPLTLGVAAAMSVARLIQMRSGQGTASLGD